MGVWRILLPASPRLLFHPRVEGKSNHRRKLVREASAEGKGHGLDLVDEHISPDSPVAGVPVNDLVNPFEDPTGDEEGGDQDPQGSPRDRQYSASTDGSLQIDGYLPPGPERTSQFSLESPGPSDDGKNDGSQSGVVPTPRSFSGGAKMETKPFSTNDARSLEPPPARNRLRETRQPKDVRDDGSIMNGSFANNPFDDPPAKSEKSAEINLSDLLQTASSIPGSDAAQGFTIHSNMPAPTYRAQSRW